jgi:hypothetical protein
LLKKADLNIRTLQTIEAEELNVLITTCRTIPARVNVFVGEVDAGAPTTNPLQRDALDSL